MVLWGPKEGIGIVAVEKVFIPFVWGSLWGPTKKYEKRIRLCDV